MGEFKVGQIVQLSDKPCQPQLDGLHIAKGCDQCESYSQEMAQLHAAVDRYRSALVETRRRLARYRCGQHRRVLGYLDEHLEATDG